MAERNIHGKKYEKLIIERYDLTEAAGYTDSWDATNKDNTPYLIKTFKKGSEIPLSDIFINSNRDKDFIMVLGIWENNKSNIVEEYIVNVRIDKFKKLFHFDYYDKMKEWIRSVSNDYSYDEIWKKECFEWKTKWGEDRIVQPRFKRDHKKQKRIQSAVTYKNIKEFIDIIKK